MENQAMFIDILKENWLHARHVESERMWFSNIFAAITVGTVAYLSKVGLQVPPLLVLLIFSLFCFLVTIKLNASFANHMKAIESIFEDGKIALGDQNEWRKYMGMLLKEGIIWKILRVGILTVYLYLLAIIVLVSTIIVIWVN